MKLILFAACFCTASIPALSQDCDFYYLRDGKTIEITSYNKKGSETGKKVSRVSGVNRLGNTTTAIVQSEFLDKKGKPGAKATSNMKCTAGIFFMDMQMFMSPEQASQVKAEAKASDVYLSYPAGMKAGDVLPDGKFSMEMQQDNGIKSTVTIDITGRKVEAQEPLTTPAGTWSCFKITYHSNVKITIMGIGIPVKADVTEWFATGFGVVKTETKAGSSVLTKLQ